MAFTWSQKKEGLQEIISEYYADSLIKEGFASYHDEGFHWYKLENDLLYKVHLWIDSPRLPIWLRVGYGIIPLFTWEPIAPSRPMRDWPWEMTSSEDHYLDSWYADIPERTIGKLPRQYGEPNISYFLSSGLPVAHLMTDRCGAEVLDEMIFPMFETLKNPEDVYAWKKQNKLYRNRCDTEDVFIRQAMECAAKGFGLGLSLTFDDECLHCRDEKLFPVIYQHAKTFTAASLPGDSKAEKNDVAFWLEHAKILASSLESQDLGIFDAEAERVRMKMLAQIKTKIPKLLG